MTEPTWWPRDPHDHVFLARALEQIGRRMFGADWTGTETSTERVALLPRDLKDASYFDRQAADILLSKHRPDLGRPAFVWGGDHEFSADHWKIACELAQRLWDERRPAIERLEAVQSEIVRSNEAGELVLRLQSRRSGHWRDFEAAWWNTDKWRSRFDQCRIDPRYPNNDRPVWLPDDDHWIFATTTSLQDVLKRLAERRSTAPATYGRKKHCTLEKYRKHWNDVIDAGKVPWPSDADDRSWAGMHGFSVESVTARRKEHIDSLPSEQREHIRLGGRRRPFPSQ